MLKATFSKDGKIRAETEKSLVFFSSGSILFYMSDSPAMQHI